MALSSEKRKRIWELHRKGLSQREILSELSTSFLSVRTVLRERYGGPPVSAMDWAPGPGRLRAEDREGIAAGLARGESFAAIGRALGRPTSTVSREVNDNGGRDDYRAFQAHQRAFERARRPKPRKLVACAELLARVTELLTKWWSPQQIANRLRLEHPDDPMMWVSHETIYQSIYVQGRGELRRELARCLRSGRAQRRPAGRLERRGQIPGMVNISERPADVGDRAVPGHWEGDLLVGKNNRSAVVTLVERSTRYVLLGKIEDQTATSVRHVVAELITRLPQHLRRSLTWDQGKEMAQHAEFSVDTNVDVYFCDPHSPWQRGSNENTNGLLRQYFPKGTDLSGYTQEQLDAAAHSLNDRPRATLDWFKPAEKLTELLVAHTA